MSFSYFDFTGEQVVERVRLVLICGCPYIIVFIISRISLKYAGYLAVLKISSSDKNCVSTFPEAVKVF